MKKFARAIFVVGLWSGLSHAQDTSDLQPPPPKPPPGTGGMYYPGMPLPAAPAAPAAGRPQGKGEDRARSGYIVREEAPVEPAEPAAPATAGTHVVKKGDTLWGLAASYFRNPWQWPKLWALNPSITNPHWIYPGDVLRLSADAPLSGEASAQTAEGAAAGAGEPPLPTPRTPAAPTGGVFLRQNGFVEPGELEAAGTVIGSKEEKVMLATLDEAYVQYGKKEPLQVGQRYTVYKPMRTVKHPQTGKRLGEIVQIFGEADVKSVTAGRIARVLIVDSTEPIERGFRVGPLRRQFKVVEARRSARDLEGLVVAALRPLELVGTEMLVFLDRGGKDGVEVGSRFVIVRRGDGYQPILWRGGPIDDKRFPREVIGQVLVVDVREGLSAGLVVQSQKEARIGDRVEMRQGE